MYDRFGRNRRRAPDQIWRRWLVAGCAAVGFGLGSAGSAEAGWGYGSRYFARTSGWGYRAYPYRLTGPGLYGYGVGSLRTGVVRYGVGYRWPSFGWSRGLLYPLGYRYVTRFGVRYYPNPGVVFPAHITAGVFVAPGAYRAGYTRLVGSVGGSDAASRGLVHDPSQLYKHYADIGRETRRYSPPMRPDNPLVVLRTRPER